MSTVLRTHLACGDCSNSGAAIWNFANTPIELVKTPEGFTYAGRGNGGEEHFSCNKCRQAIKRFPPPIRSLLMTKDLGELRPPFVRNVNREQH